MLEYQISFVLDGLGKISNASCTILKETSLHD